MDSFLNNAIHQKSQFWEHPEISTAIFNRLSKFFIPPIVIYTIYQIINFDKIRILVGTALTLGYSSLIRLHRKEPNSTLPSMLLLLFVNFTSLVVYLFAPANSVYITLILILPFYGLCLGGPFGLIFSIFVILLTYLLKLLVIDPNTMVPLYFRAEGIAFLLVIAFAACLALIPFWVLYDELRKELHENQEQTDRFSRIFYSTPVAFIEKDFTKLFERFADFSSESELREYLYSKHNIINLIKGLEIRTANEKALELFGYDTEEEIKGNKLTIFVWDPISDLASKIIDLYNGKRNVSGIEQIRTKNQTNILVGYNIEFISHKSSVFGIFTIIEITHKNLVSSEIDELNQKYENYIREFHHLVKNNLQFLISLVELMGISSNPSEFVLDSIHTRLESMNVIYTLLDDINLSTDKINIADHISKLVRFFKSKSAKKFQDISFEYNLDDHFLSLKSAISFGMLLTEILANAVEHAFDTGSGIIEIESKKNENNQIIYHIQDNGIGFDITEYIGDELAFRAGTKSSDKENYPKKWDFGSHALGYTSLGLNLIYMLARQYSVKVLMSSNDNGTVYCITTEFN